jgi:hypothetical protein
VTAKLITFLVEFSVIAVVWGAVMVTYHWQSGGRWRRSAVGGHLMATAACFTWSAALTVINLLAGDYAGRFVVQVASYGAFAIIGVQRLVLMALQRHREVWVRRSAEPEPAPPRREP